VKRPSLTLLGVTALAVLAATITPLASASTPASAATSTAVLSVSSTNDPGYPAGRQHAAVGRSVTIGVATLSRGITVVGPESKSGAGDGIRITVEPPQGKSLTVGRYGVDSRSQDPSLARAELVVGSVSQSFIGDVEVLDLAADAAGALTRFDVVFRNGTATPSYAFFGQLRFGQPGDTGAVPTATTIQYPDTPVGSVPVTTTETIVNTGSAPVTMGAAAVTSGTSGDFPITADTCSRTTLAAGAKCTFTIGFTPTKAGPRAGVVSIATGGVTRRISLAGSAPLGTTGITYRGDDYVSGGTTHAFPDGSFATVVGRSSSDGYAFVPTRPYGLDSGADTTRVEVVRYGGGPLQVGTFDTSEATGPAEGSTAKYGLSVSGSGRGCGSYTGRLTVSSFAVDSTGAVTSARLSWTLRCTFTPGTMTGSLSWRDRSDKTAPAAVTSLAIATASSTRTATWRASTSADAVGTVVRLVPGAGVGALPTSGLPVTSTGATSATLPALTSGRQYTLIAWSVDSSGNVGARTATSVKG